MTAVILGDMRLQTQPIREIPIAEQVREWENDEVERMNTKHARPFASSRDGVDGGAVRHSNREQVELEQLERERPSRSSHAEH
jgi:hypothetical protein